jgi:hypothetical protein
MPSRVQTPRVVRETGRPTTFLSFGGLPRREAKGVLPAPAADGTGQLSSVKRRMSLRLNI